MNPNLTEIAYLLDRSGSMQSLRESAIAGFNTFLDEQRRVPGDARFSLVLFDDTVETVCDRRPLDQVPGLTAESYVPHSMTALLDAVGHTLDSLGARLAAESERDRPGKVVVAIFTDGYENASRRYRLDEIAERIARRRDRDQWEFLFLAAGQDAIATAATMGIGRERAAPVGYSPEGMSAAAKSLSRKITALRRRFSAGEGGPDLRKSMNEIVREEE